MRKVLCCVAGLSLLFTASSAFAGGFSIAPAQSYDGIAKSGANVASAEGAEAVYYNLAGAAFVENGWLFQTSVNFIHLDSVKYRNDPRNTDPQYTNVANWMAQNAAGSYSYPAGKALGTATAGILTGAVNYNAEGPTGNLAAARLSRGLYNGYDADSREGNFTLPSIFLLSPEWKGFRFGFAVVTPFGLSFRWGDDSPYAEIFNQKFSLQMSELNPNLTYKVSDKFSVGGGARLVLARATIANKINPGYEFGYVRKSASGGALAGTQYVDVIAMVDADHFYDASTTEWGYNLAADYKVSKDWNLAVTFRSKVDLNYTGVQTINATAWSYNGVGNGTSGQLIHPGSKLFGPDAVNPYYAPATLGGVAAAFQNTAGRAAPAGATGRVAMNGLIDPALLNISIAHTFAEKTTVELTYLRTFWSGLKAVTFSPTLPDGGNDGIKGVADSMNVQGVKNWHDTSDVQLGLTHKLNPKLTLMGGVGYGESPIPDQTMAFDLPDSDAYTFSIGAKYAITKNLEIGFGALYQVRVNHSAHQGYALQQTYDANHNPNPISSTTAGNLPSTYSTTTPPVGGPIPTTLSSYIGGGSPVPGQTWNSTTADGQVNGDFQDMSGYMLSVGLQYKF